MSGQSCQSLTWETLIAYWLGELDADAESRAEEHYLRCEPCSRRLGQLAALASGVRSLARPSGVEMATSDEFVRRLRHECVRVREYRVPRNGSVNCTAGPEDDFVVGRLESSLAGVQRVDVLTLDEEGNIQTRQQDVLLVADSDGGCSPQGSTGCAPRRPLPCSCACSPSMTRASALSATTRSTTRPTHRSVLGELNAACAGLCD